MDSYLRYAFRIFAGKRVVRWQPWSNWSFRICQRMRCGMWPSQSDHHGVSCSVQISVFEWKFTPSWNICFTSILLMRHIKTNYFQLQPLKLEMALTHPWLSCIALQQTSPCCARTMVLHISSTISVEAGHWHAESHPVWYIPTIPRFVWQTCFEKHMFYVCQRTPIKVS